MLVVERAHRLGVYFDAGEDRRLQDPLDEQVPPGFAAQNIQRRVPTVELGFERPVVGEAGADRLDAGVDLGVVHRDAPPLGLPQQQVERHEAVEHGPVDAVPELRGQRLPGLDLGAAHRPLELVARDRVVVDAGHDLGQLGRHGLHRRRRRGVGRPRRRLDRIAGRGRAAAGGEPEHEQPPSPGRAGTTNHPSIIRRRRGRDEPGCPRGRRREGRLPRGPRFLGRAARGRRRVPEAVRCGGVSVGFTGVVSDGPAVAPGNRPRRCTPGRRGRGRRRTDRRSRAARRDSRP